MDREKREELEEEEAQGIAVWEIHDPQHRARLQREQAEGVEVFTDPDADLLAERELEEAEGYGWIPEHAQPRVGSEKEGGSKVSAERVREYLMTHGIRYELHTHPTAFTAQEVAAAEHIPGFEVAKPVLLESAGQLVMAVLPAPYRVDLEKAKAALGTDQVAMASEDQFSPRFPDCDRGAEPPFGNLYGLPTYVDRRLTSEQITFNAGTHTETITMARDDYMRIVNPEVTDLAEGS